MPLPEGRFWRILLRVMSVPLTSLALCIIVIAIAFAGGLWAVLVTDVLQFVILTVSVVFRCASHTYESGRLGIVR